MFTGDQDLSFFLKVHGLNQYLSRSPRTILECDSRGGRPAYAEDKELRKKETFDPERSAG